MAKPLQIQIVERARSLIAEERHWCRGQERQNSYVLGPCPLLTQSRH